MTGVSVGVMCYGASGAGKSYTAHGTEQDPGIVPHFCKDLFTRLEKTYGGQDFKNTIKVSFLEIYENKIVDLLQKREENRKVKSTTPLSPGRGLSVRHSQLMMFNSCPVLDATELEIVDERELLDAFGVGFMRLHRLKVTEGEIKRNVSLSHSVFIVTIMREHIASGSCTNSQFFVVDLAGPFKVAELGITTRGKLKSLKESDQRLMRNLNQSLVPFRKVMLFSDTKSNGRHKPYRDSKVTQILEPLLEKGKTTLLLHVSGASKNARKTVETLRFGLKASELSKGEITKNVTIRSYTTEQDKAEVIYLNAASGKRRTSSGIKDKV